ncbi:hypothetical protein [Streptomyces virginiae]
MDTRIKVAVLREGIRATQPSRHASGKGGLESFHIFGLVELHCHESLQRLSGEREERALRGTMAADRRARFLASTVVQRIGLGEAARRAALAHDQYPSGNPYVMVVGVCDRVI